MIDTTRHDSEFDSIAFGNTPVVIVGLGPVGSIMAMQIAKLGVSNLKLCDTGFVNEFDLIGGVYVKQDLGEKRVVALANRIYVATGLQAKVVSELLSKNLRGVIIYSRDSGGDLTVSDFVDRFLTNNPSCKGFVGVDCDETGAYVYARPKALLSKDPFAELEKSQDSIESRKVLPLLVPFIALWAATATWQFMRLAGEDPKLDPVLSLDVESVIGTEGARLDELPAFDLREPLDVIGVGSLGSHLVSLLNLMGYSDIRVIDPDSVEDHNLANQAFYLDHIGLPKVDALADLIRAHGGTELLTLKQEFSIATDGTFSLPLRRAVFAMVDSMAARKAIVRGCVYSSSELMVEARLGAAEGRVYAVDVLDSRSFDFWHKHSNYGDEVSDPNSCQIQTTVGSTALATAALACIRFSLSRCLDDRRAPYDGCGLTLKPFGFSTTLG